MAEKQSKDIFSIEETSKERKKGESEGGGLFNSVYKDRNERVHTVRNPAKRELTPLPLLRVLSGWSLLIIIICSPGSDKDPPICERPYRDDKRGMRTVKRAKSPTQARAVYAQDLGRIRDPLRAEKQRRKKRRNITNFQFKSKQKMFHRDFPKLCR